MRKSKIAISTLAIEPQNKFTAAISYWILILFCLTIAFSCKKDKPEPDPDPVAEKRLIFRFKFDSTQVRLDNFGNPSTMPANHRGQSPKFNKISAHYIELAPDSLTQVGYGKVIYHAQETNLGGATAIDFSKSIIKSENEDFYSVPLSSVVGNYKWIRVSISYQNYDIRYKYVHPSPLTTIYGTGTIASFVGYNTYLTSYQVKTQTITPAIPGNKLQGYWGWETTNFSVTSTQEGQAPPGATTVVNPISSTSPIPAGSCLVTGRFANALNIFGNENGDVIVTISLSTNNSFEWKEAAGDNYFEPTAGDTVVDMGLRGLIPIIQ